MAPMKLGNFEYGLEPVRLGDLGGNQFTVVVRSVVSHREGVEVEECAREGVRALEERGFVNYFGVQRFGMDGATPVAPLVGLAMLRGEHVSGWGGGGGGLAVLHGEHVVWGWLEHMSGRGGGGGGLLPESMIIQDGGGGTGRAWKGDGLSMTVF